MAASDITVNINVPRASLIALLSSAESVAADIGSRHARAIAVSTTLNPAQLPRLYLDSDGKEVEAGSSAHVATHFTSAGLVFDVRPWKRVQSLKEAQAVAAECDLLGRKGEWVIGQDFETQLIIDRDFHAPAVNKKSFPNAPTEGLVYTSRPAAWSSGLVWFVYLLNGFVYWLVDVGGLAVPVLRVPPSQ